jgi:hypothetical protein
MMTWTIQVSLYVEDVADIDDVAFERLSWGPRVDSGMKMEWRSMVQLPEPATCTK